MRVKTISTSQNEKEFYPNESQKNELVRLEKQADKRRLASFYFLLVCLIPAALISQIFAYKPNGMGALYAIVFFAFPFSGVVLFNILGNTTQRKSMEYIMRECGWDGTGQIVVQCKKPVTGPGRLLGQSEYTC